MKNEIIYKGTEYRIGAQIIATEQSEYRGLFGIITEIRDGEKETPEIYCSFEAPVLPYEVKVLEGRFSALRHEAMTIDEINLDSVLMAPEMIDLRDDLDECRLHLTVYVVMEEWGNDDGHNRVHQICTNYNDAKRLMVQQLKGQMEDDDIQRWRDDAFMEESGPDSYECYIDGEYSEKHYAISIITEELCVSEKFVGEIAKDYKSSGLLEDFVSQVSQWDEVEGLTDEQYERMIHDPQLPEKLNNALDANDFYQKAYWTTMTEIACALLKEYLGKPDCNTPETDNSET